VHAKDERRAVPHPGPGPADGRGAPLKLEAPADLDAVRTRLLSAVPTSMDVPGFRRAAVLVPLLDTPTGWELLFTVRAAGLRKHAGQIAFPGGRVEDDEDVVGAALRETEEEVGLSVQRGAVLGALDDHPSPAGYVATPLVAVVAWPQAVRVNPEEVEEIFTVPLADLAAIRPESEERELRSYRRTIYTYPWSDRRIWGFTGNVVKNLLDVVIGVPS
jgi:8-oxo-dGTP pyrophosphatase MutT (NUDIX family)